MKSDSVPAFALEKEALKTEIEAGIQTGVEQMASGQKDKKPVEKYHNTRHLLRQYRKVAYAVEISETDMNVRMEMEHGTRLSTLKVNAELAGVDLSGSKIESYARTVIRSKNMLRKNTTVYKATGKGNEYEKCGRLRLKTKEPELRIDRLKEIPEGVIAVEVDQSVAKKLFGQTIAIRCYDNTVEHTVGTVNGPYWFKVDVGTQAGESDSEEEPT